MRVGHPVVEVEDHDGGDAAAGHHEHDAVEVGAWHGEHAAALRGYLGTYLGCHAL